MTLVRRCQLAHELTDYTEMGPTRLIFPACRVPPTILWHEDRDYWGILWAK